jgi:hypothetical protein
MAAVAVGDLTAARKRAIGCLVGQGPLPRLPLKIPAALPLPACRFPGPAPAEGGAGFCAAPSWLADICDGRLVCCGLPRPAAPWRTWRISSS